MANETNRLAGKRIAFLMANEGVEEIELTRPMSAVRNAGATAEIVAPKPGTIQAFNHLDKSKTYDVDEIVAQLNPDDYDAVVLPGGVANPDQLRMDETAVKFLHAFAETGKPVAAICHAPWTLIEAGIAEGRTMTSWPSLQTDLRNAGANWVDQQTVIDGPLLTSRKPDDLDAFCSELINMVASSS